MTYKEKLMTYHMIKKPTEKVKTTSKKSSEKKKMRKGIITVSKCQAMPFLGGYNPKIFKQIIILRRGNKTLWLRSHAQDGDLVNWSIFPVLRHWSCEARAITPCLPRKARRRSQAIEAIYPPRVPTGLGEVMREEEKA